MGKVAGTARSRGGTKKVAGGWSGFSEMDGTVVGQIDLGGLGMDSELV